MKKLTLSLLLLVVLVLAACGEKSEPSPETTTSTETSSDNEVAPPLMSELAFVLDPDGAQGPRPSEERMISCSPGEQIEDVNSVPKEEQVPQEVVPEELSSPPEQGMLPKESSQAPTPEIQIEPAPMPGDMSMSPRMRKLEKNFREIPQGSIEGKEVQPKLPPRIEKSIQIGKRGQSGKFQSEPAKSGNSKQGTPPGKAGQKFKQVSPKEEPAFRSKELPPQVKVDPDTPRSKKVTPPENKDVYYPDDEEMQEALACANLQELPASALKPVQKGDLCTELYGGPDTLSVEGEYFQPGQIDYYQSDAQKIELQLTRANGCNIDKFDEWLKVVQPLYPDYKPGSAIGPAVETPKK